MLALTAATAVVSFTYLGSLTAPQNPLDATDTTLTESVTLQGGHSGAVGVPGHLLRWADDRDRRCRHDRL